MESETRSDPVPVSRRAALATLGVGVAGLAIGNRAAETAGWRRFASARSGIEVSYPAAWSFEETPQPSLVTPAQSFGVRSDETNVLGEDWRPDLRYYPSDGVVLWVFYYDSVLGNCRKPSGLTLADLTFTVSGNERFEQYVGCFAGTHRTFLLNAWVGANADKNKERLSSVLTSIRLP